MNRMKIALALMPLSLTDPAGAQPAAASAEEAVGYASGDVTIAATLFLPHRNGAVPAIVLIHGAEGMPRNSPMYRDNAGFFTSLGYAVLVWDKRGVGGTPGTYQESRALAESARDVIAGAEYLKTRAEVDSGKIGVYGVSQGGWIGPLAATMSPAIAFVIANSGPGVTISESNIAQRANEWIEDGFTDADTAEIKAFLRETWRYYGTGVGYDRANAARAVARSRPWFQKIGFPDSTPKPDRLADTRYDYYRQGQYDPDSVLRKVSVPVLAVFGDMDRHIPMPESATRFADALKAAKHPDHVVKVFSGAGHGIRIIPTGEIERLRNASPPAAHGGRHEYAPEFRPFLAKWLRDRFPTRF